MSGKKFLSFELFIDLQSASVRKISRLETAESNSKRVLMAGRMKYILSQFLIMFILPAYTLDLFIDNDIQIIYKDQYCLLSEVQGDYFIYEPGAPWIPAKRIFLEIPPGLCVESATVDMYDVEIIHLTKPLVPVPEAKPLGFQTDSPLQPVRSQYYHQERFPEQIIQNKGQGYCGNRNIGILTCYQAIYYPADNRLEIPRQIKITVTFAESSKSASLQAGYVSERVAALLDLPGRGEFDDDGYLLLTGDEFPASFQPLLEWRNLQGKRVYHETITSIAGLYQGRDLQEKIRNCIIHYYQNEAISHVTLGGDINSLPDRKLYAFDCAFGANTDENDIPGDIYYSCLDGDWDANSNNIFGEDDDLPDYFPEVFVSRIPVNQLEEIEDYINRLIIYEKGYLEDYTRAGGLSMELWPDSQSEICQLYIYQQYFPDYFDIEFLYGETNNESNAFQMMNANQNIIQHTGHAGKTSLSLEDGRIRNENLDQLSNEYGGIFYSIGCWSAAFDYNSIGENLVVSIGKGQLGYIGNSRYGWGAPAAPAFGFSEFFQKEFFRLLFMENFASLAELNALQKISFIPYFWGTSVYKWCAYELNALGDACFSLYLNNPPAINFQALQVENSLFLQLSSEGIPLADAFVTCREFQGYSNDLGEIVITPFSGEDTLSVYRRGYQFLEIPPETVLPEIYIGNIRGINNHGYQSGESLIVDCTLYNPTLQGFDFFMTELCDNSHITIYGDSIQLSIGPQEQMDLPSLNIMIEDNSNNHLLYGDDPVFTIRINDTAADSIRAERQIIIPISSPVLQVCRYLTGNDHVEAGMSLPVQISVINNGNLAAEGINLSYSCSEEFVTFAQNHIELNLQIPSGQEETFFNTLIIAPEAPDDFTALFQANIITVSQGIPYQFYSEFVLTAGDIGFSDDFETGSLWPGDTAWQRVQTQAYSGEYSFSCRPEQTGQYQTETPIMQYQPGSVISFWYKYQLPMYGNDGVYFKITSETREDTLLFLGAGGALLSEQIRDPQVYTFSNWSQYELDINETLLHQLVPGEDFQVELIFNFSELITGFNEYAAIDTIGIFLDDILISSVVNNEPEDYPDRQDIAIYPNPASKYNWPKFSVTVPATGFIKSAIFNIRGQLVDTIFSNRLEAGAHVLYWDGRDSRGSYVAAGVYFINIDTGSSNLQKRFVVID